MAILISNSEKLNQKIGCYTSIKISDGLSNLIKLSFQ